MTSQPDWLVFRGRRRMLFNHPLDSYLRDLPGRPDFRLRGTGHWRGYVATWEIRTDDTLWLTGLKTRPEEDGSDPGLRAVFPDATGPVPATWVALRLRTPDGEQLRYVHLGYESRYAQETFLTVWGGRLILVEEYQGGTMRRVGGECTPHLETMFGAEEGSFLRAVHSAPEDDAPKLVYADWLDERGDPRGPVIRVADRIRRLGPEAAAREVASQRDTLRRGLGHWLWVQVMGYGELATRAVLDS